MKTIGLLGGMSWESTLEYYKAINLGVQEALGGLHSAKIVIHSVDFAPLEKHQHAGQWDKIAHLLTQAALNVQAAGADCLLVCTNTMHKVAPQIQAAIDIPLLHIADATAETLMADKIEAVGLLGTAFTMEQPFYKARLADNYGLRVITPEQQERKVVHDVIYQELCMGLIRDKSKQYYLQVIDNLAAQGAQGIILGCTEIGLLVKQADTDVKLLDTTAIHAQKAVQYALGQD